jgi:hypothetical protein
MGFKTKTTAACVAALVALFANTCIQKPWLARMFRNAALPIVPSPLKPVYPSCSDAELIDGMSFVVTVKDTCAQAEELLTHLAEIFPRDMHVYYGGPSIRGCRHVDGTGILSKLFTHYTVVSTEIDSSPITAFLKVQPLLKTKYAVLMHNDAYPMERDFACESLRALDAHPEYPIVAPQIYERAADGIIVPHGHHQNLHTRPQADGSGSFIDYDLSMDLLTQRLPEDFKEGPQRDFLEDHAFIARSNIYHELLDPAGSFTMEYMDMILNMRARNTSAWYVPTARCYFEVDTNKLTWEDIPYFVYKRSEQIGHQVRNYLTNKWGVAFPNSGIWNYVRYVFVPYLMLEEESLPKEWADQAAIFYSWFESVGFNRYNTQFLPEFINSPSDGPVTVSRETKLELDTNVPDHRVPPMSASEILPTMAKKTFGAPQIAFKEPHIPIGLKMSSCKASEPSSYALCGLAVQDGDSCKCWTYVEGFNLRTTFGLDNLMALLKLPPRAFTFAQMKYWPQKIDSGNTDFLCEAAQSDCKLEVQFSKAARILQWSWYGKVSQRAFTPEGLAIAAGLVAAIIMLVIPARFVTKRAKSSKKDMMKPIASLRRGLCKVGM